MNGSKHRFRARLACLSLGAVVLCVSIGGGCGGRETEIPFSPLEGAAPVVPGATTAQPATETPPSEPTAGGAALGALPTPGDVDPEALLRAVIELVRNAPINPGGQNFDIAKDYLNQYFASTAPATFGMSDASRAYLQRQLGTTANRAIADLETPTFTQRDARHIEDCLVLNTVARRVAGDGDDLTRVTRVFDWLVQQVQLVPAGSLAPSGMSQAQARPYDVLLRGMATEQGGWAERGWSFIALCRQLGIDAGLLVYRKPTTSILLVEPAKTAPPADDRRVWACVALIDGKAHLFDCRLGIPIPGPDGRGVATLDQALADPAVLAQLNLPGRPYSTQQGDLAGTRLTVWLDSSLGHLAPRMRELQQRLAGRDRMVLFRDPAEQDASFRAALGDRFQGTELWSLPLEVEFRLFNDPDFVRMTQFAIEIFRPELPLLAARMGQLRGELDRSVESYAGFRFADNPVMNDGKTPIPPQIQDVLDLYATYYLGLAKLDQGQPSLARGFFEQTLRLMPRPGPDFQPYFTMYRWGAESNLGKICAREGDRTAAIRHLAEPQPTPEEVGNLIQARRLIWEDPFVPDQASGPASGTAGH